MVISRIRRLVYKAGFRPKLGNPFHSPSLDMIYAAKKGFVHLKGQDFDGKTFLKLGEMKPISIFGPDQVASRHPDIPDQVKWMALNEGEIELYEPEYSDLWYKAQETGIPYSELVHRSIDKIIENTRAKPFMIQLPRKQGRTKMMEEMIKHNLQYGKGSVAYVGPSMTIKERPNPWPIGTDAWHLWNLRGNSWGHSESVRNGLQGLEWVMVVYTAGAFYYNAQKATNDVRTAKEGMSERLGIPVDGVWTFLLEVPEELL